MNELPLENVPPEKLALYNAIVGSYRDIVFEVNSSEYRFTFCNAHDDYNASIYFKLKLNEQHMVVGLESIPSASLFSKEYEEVDITALPKEVQPIMIESLAAGVLSTIEEAFGARAMIEEVAVEPFSGGDEHLYFEVEPLSGGNTFRGHIVTTLDGLELISTALPKGAIGVGNRFSEVDMVARIVIGKETLSYSEYNEVNQNDVILFNGGNFMESGQCEVILGDKMSFAASYQEGALTITESGRAMNGDDNDYMDSDMQEPEEPMPQANYDEEPMPSQENSEEAMHKPKEAEMHADIKGLPVHLRFEVGEKRMSIEELNQLQPGYTFELGTSLEEPVTIRANGKAVGKGELVKVGERVGVRVKELKG